MSGYVQGQPSAPLLALNLTIPSSLFSTDSSEFLSSLQRSSRPEHGPRQPSYHQSTTTAYLLSLRLQPPPERPLLRRPITRVRAKVIGSGVPAGFVPSTIGTAEGGVR